MHFIDKIGGTLAFPFFALYITGKFHVGMTEAGILLGLLSLAGIVGSVIGGALTDRLGRRKLILFGLVASALSALTFGSVNRFAWLFPVAASSDYFQKWAARARGDDCRHPPEGAAQEGFGILRVVGNMAWLVGPTVGGFVARSSFFALFVIDAAISCIVAVLFYLFMDGDQAGAARARHGRRRSSRRSATIASCSRDKAFVAFLVAAVLMGMVYIQMYNSLSVYLRDNHGIQPQGYGFLLTSSAITVICFQFWTMRVIKRQPQFLMMALGTVFYLSGSACSASCRRTGCSCWRSSSSPSAR